MKILDANGAMPGIADTYVSYEGSISNDGGYWGNGWGGYWLINTEIRSGLFAIINGRTLTSTPINFELPFEIITTTKGTLQIRVNIPSMATCYYRISGHTSITEPVHHEVEQSTYPIAVDFQMAHNHDGINSRRLLVNDLDVLDDKEDRYIIVNSTSSGITYGEEATGLPVFPNKVWVAPDIPDEGLVINTTSGSSTTFTWNAATNMTSGDDYDLYVIDPEHTVIHTQNVDGDVETMDVLDNAFVNQNSANLWVYVVATNAAGQDTTLIFIPLTITPFQ